jgi:adenylyltransferase/sulfurtransferase
MREIDARDLAARLASGEATLLVDVREQWEHALVALPESVLVPLGELPARHREVAPEAGALVVTYCHHGIRSLQAAVFLAAHGHPDVVSLAGGIDAWARVVDPSLARY